MLRLKWWYILFIVLTPVVTIVIFLVNPLNDEYFFGYPLGQRWLGISLLISAILSILWIILGLNTLVAISKSYTGIFKYIVLILLILSMLANLFIAFLAGRVGLGCVVITKDPCIHI